MIEGPTVSLGREGDSRDTAEFRLLFVSGLAAIVGVTSGGVAFVLYKLIALLTNLSYFHTVSFIFRAPHGAPMHRWSILIPVGGGLIVGVMARYGTPKIRGHGIPEAMEAVMENRSRISPRVAIFKPISAAIAIGTGGPFGAEGPIIQTGGALGSIVGQLIRTTVSERKTLLAAGAAAGMAATFSTPIAGVILAIELLLFEFKARSFIPLVIASTLATSVHFVLLGRGPMFNVAPVDFQVPTALPYYVLLGLLCGLGAVVFSNALYWVEDQFEKLQVDPLWWPAIGGLGLGIIGFFVPRVLGVGYDVISDILNARLPLTILAIIMCCKSLALLVSLGSGTSGGLLAPMFMVGAAMGGAFSICLNHLMPGLHLSPGAFALAAMAGLFGAASRAAFTFMVFAFELTRNYDSVLPLMLVTVIADGVGLLLMKNSIMTEKLARRGLRIHQDYEADVIQQADVEDVMLRNPPTVPSTMRVSELIKLISSGEAPFSGHHGLCIVNERGELCGIITQGDAFRALVADPEGRKTVIEAGVDTPTVAYPDEPLHDAVIRMLRRDVGRLPVVDRQNPRKLLGYLGRSGVLEARRRHVEHETVREEAWLVNSAAVRFRKFARSTPLARRRSASHPLPGSPESDSPGIDRSGPHAAH